MHYNLANLELADAAMRQAIQKANDLEIALIVAGDLHDTKANMRAECVNRMIETFKLSKTETYLIRGNHDSINEKSTEHSLNYLNDYCTIISRVLIYSFSPRIYLIAYDSNRANLSSLIKTTWNENILIMHQGLQGSNSGEYIQDKSALTKEDVAGFRVISGHYHARQTINLPDGGKWDYIGNPYTLNFGEANDPEKGFQILYNDGSLEFVPTNLRKHVVIEVEAALPHNIIKGSGFDSIKRGDLVQLKVVGTKEQLSKINKETFPELSDINFKLDLIAVNHKIELTKKPRTNHELLDSIIDSTDNSNEVKTRLKQTWRNLCES